MASAFDAMMMPKKTDLSKPWRVSVAAEDMVILVARDGIQACSINKGEILNDKNKGKANHNIFWVFRIRMPFVGPQFPCASCFGRKGFKGFGFGRCRPQRSMKLD